METPSSSTLSTPKRKFKRNVNIGRGIPLLPQPNIQCNMPALENAAFVNVVLEKYNNEHPSSGTANDTDPAKYFRISDDKNNEICRFVECTQTQRENIHGTHWKKGIKYLECKDMENKCIMFVAYPVGLGEVALLSANEELIGECQSNVEFVCLSVKVKYNFYDANGQRVMKMTAILSENENEKKKFTLMVKNSKNEKMALIQMGLLKSCCHIKFKVSQTNCVERLQIIALWVGFMHNELEEREVSKSYTGADKQRKESQSLSTSIGMENRQQSRSHAHHDETSSRVSQNDAAYHSHHHQQPNKMAKYSRPRQSSNLKNWKDLVKSRLPAARRINNNNEDFDGAQSSKTS